MNHRVANSLTLVSVLLRRSERGVTEPAAIAALRAAAARVDGVSRLHRHLYALSGQGSVDLTDLLPVLCRDIGDTLALDVRLHPAVAPFPMPAQLAADVAMILNELAINAMKHAYDWRSGTLRVSAMLEADGVVLTVRDDGPGLPDGFVPEAAGGLGMRLVLGVVERHGGTLSADTDGGAVFRIGLPATSADR
ncbi:sensor histidine kinase [Wenxinia marina]|nr:sensor histidine kinase [Wenxinia marina]